MAISRRVPTRVALGTRAHTVSFCLILSHRVFLSGSSMPVRVLKEESGEFGAVMMPTPYGEES